MSKSTRRKKKKSTRLWPEAEEANRAAEMQAKAGSDLTLQDLEDAYDHESTCWCAACQVVFSDNFDQDEFNALWLKGENKDMKWFGRSDSSKDPGGAPFGSTPSSTSPKSEPWKLEPKCAHVGDKVQFWLNKEKTLGMSGGTGSSVVPGDDCVLIVDLAGHVYQSKWVKEAPAKLRHLDLGEFNPDYMQLDWTDQWPPDVGPGWFEKLYKALLKSYIPKEGAGNVIFACIGGHGRTGTAMASMLLTAWPKMTVEDAILLVRKKHCKKAIETWRQAKYLMGYRPGATFEKWLLKEAEEPKWVKNAAGTVSTYTGGSSYYGGPSSPGTNGGSPPLAPTLVCTPTKQ